MYAIVSVVVRGDLRQRLVVDRRNLTDCPTVHGLLTSQSVSTWLCADWWALPWRAGAGHGRAAGDLRGHARRLPPDTGLRGCASPRLAALPSHRCRRACQHRNPAGARRKSKDSRRAPGPWPSTSSSTNFRVHSLHPASLSLVAAAAPPCVAQGEGRVRPIGLMGESRVKMKAGMGGWHGVQGGGACTRACCPTWPRSRPPPPSPGRCSREPRRAWALMTEGADDCCGQIR